MAKKAMNRRRVIGVGLVAGAVAFGLTAYLGWLRPTLADAPIGNGYLAGWMCSGVFISGRTPDDLWAQEFGSETDPGLARRVVTVDRRAGTTRASLWYYSSGTSNILSGIVRATFGGDDEAYWRFPNDALFAPLGCRSAVFQTDTAGTFVGSSYVFASARDWARLGLLLLDDGVWQGERLLPEGWVDYLRTPAPADPERHYGAQTWLVGAESYDEPAPVFEMRGHGDQFVTIVPEADLVVVRLGWQNVPGGWDHRAFLERVVAAVGHDPGGESS